MSQQTLSDTPTVLIIGVGDVSVRVAHLLASQERPVKVVLASRSLERATRYANLTRFAAENLGLVRDASAVATDLKDPARTAAMISGVRPDVIFMGASMQAARAIADLPEDAYRQLDEAQLGPWLPMHLTLVQELMAAVELADCAPKVVNAAYPDAVGPALRTVGMAPLIGIGNVGNVIPALKFASAQQLGTTVEHAEVRLVAHHFFSHHVHRTGEADGVPYLLRVSSGGVEQGIDAPRLFASLAGVFRRQGGKEGQQLTATSALSVIRAALGWTDGVVHAPAPAGLVGGYPIRVKDGVFTPCLPPGVDLQEAEAINRACQHLDGIAEIAPNGVVRFAEENMSVMKRILGYDCTEMKVGEAREHAEELGERYSSYLVARGYLRP